MRITATEIQGDEGRCKISKVQSLGVGNSWRWSLTCSAEGTDYTSQEIVLVRPGSILRYDSDGAVWEGVRCD